MMRIKSPEPTIAQLNKRAEKFGMTIYKAHGEDSYLLIDVATSDIVTPLPLTFEELTACLDDKEQKNLA